MVEKNIITTEETLPVLKTKEEMIEDAVALIDINDQNSILFIGEQAQKSISKASDVLLKKVQGKDAGEIGEKLNGLGLQLREQNPAGIMKNENRGGFFKMLIKKGENKLITAANRYKSVGAQIDSIGAQLQADQRRLIMDNDTLKEMGDLARESVMELDVLIEAARRSIEKLKAQIAENESKLSEAENVELAQTEIARMNNTLDVLERKVIDLLGSKQIAVQQIPQIEMIRSGNLILADKVGTAINHAIPAWKVGASIVIKSYEQKAMIEKTKTVSDATNEMIKMNAELLAGNAVDIAKMSQETFIDVDALEEAQNTMLKMIDDVVETCKEGQEKRKEMEKKLLSLGEIKIGKIA